MEEVQGVVKHVLLAKFKHEMTPEKIDQIIKDFAKLIDQIESLKAFHWGKDVGILNMDQGFTHVFECTFESAEGVAEYAAHPLHVEYANVFLPTLEKFVVLDYKPTIVRC